MGGFAHGEAGFDACDMCGGEGERVHYECPVALLTGDCGERLIRTAVRFDHRQTQTWRCLNGHRFTLSYVGSAWQWVRGEDHAALAVEVA